MSEYVAVCTASYTPPMNEPGLPLPTARCERCEHGPGWHFGGGWRWNSETGEVRRPADR